MCKLARRPLLGFGKTAPMQAEPRAVLVVGAQAAGKSTIARALAARLERGAFVEGDVLWKMVVAGGVDMSADPEPEAQRQLALRYAHGALLCESFVSNGFVAVHAENMYGPMVEEHLRSLACARSLVVLRPLPEVIEQRELERGTDAYSSWVGPGRTRLDAIKQFDHWLAETPRIGLWIDSSTLTVDETVDHILTHWDDAIVD